MSKSFLGTTPRSTKPVILVHENLSYLRAESGKKARVETRIKSTTPLSTSASTSTSSSNASSSALVTKLTPGKKYRLIIPIIKPITYTEWATYPSMPVTDKSRKTTGERNEGTNLQINEHSIENSNSRLNAGSLFYTTGNEELVLIL